MEKTTNNHESSEASSFFINDFDAATELSSSEETL